MAQVIIVSNRLPISVKKENAKLVFSPSLGGIATGLSSYVEDPGNTWIGWPGIASDELNENDKQLIANELTRHNCYPVFLSQKQIDNFYNGYSNSVLWPLFHNLPAKRFSSERLDPWWQAYRKVNQQFGEAVSNLANSKSQIWVHDYLLMLLPEILRSQEQERAAHIGFFLHIPFPDRKTFTGLPEAKRLMNGMLGADLIGFHTTDYVRNFMSSVSAMGIATVNANQVTLGTRSVRVAEFPMGIDYEKYAAASKSKEVKSAAKEYKKRYARCKVIVSVDRLDPTKGLEERLRAYNELLKRNPAQRGKVIFAMVAAPSRTDIAVYARLGKRLEALAKTINKTYGSAKWQPVDYINVAQPFEKVAALFQIADVAFIAPLRDGMNLSAKEFVASNHKHGVLILSETAGAAQELHDALIVNPRKPESLVSALEQALSMRKRELRGRLKRMKKDLSINTVQHWAKTFVDTLQQPIPGTPRLTRTLNKHLIQNLEADYIQAKKRLLLLDYDGSLAPFATDYRNAKPSKSLIKLLENLITDRANDVVIISGRSAIDLDAWFGSLTVNLVSEHGAATKKAGNKTWQSVEKNDTNWKELLLPALEKYVRLAPGARIEIKPHSLVWHYRATTPYYAQKYTVIIKRALKPFLKTHGLELVQGNKVLEIKNPRISKANAAQPWLERDYPFVLAIGDDITDESLFTHLPSSSYSIKVGRGRTAARFRLASSKEIVSLLRKLVRT